MNLLSFWISDNQNKTEFFNGRLSVALIVCFGNKLCNELVITL